MLDRLARARRFRLNAERLRIAAENQVNGSDKETSLEVARDFERMAEELERSANGAGIFRL